MKTTSQLCVLSQAELIKTSSQSLLKLQTKWSLFIRNTIHGSGCSVEDPEEVWASTSVPWWRCQMGPELFCMVWYFSGSNLVHTPYLMPAWFDTWMGQAWYTHHIWCLLDLTLQWVRPGTHYTCIWYLLDLTLQWVRPGLARTLYMHLISAWSDTSVDHTWHTHCIWRPLYLMPTVSDACMVWHKQGDLWLLLAIAGDC